MRTKPTFIMLWAFLLLTVKLFAQAPQKFNYQAVVRDDAGNLVSEQLVSIKISILQGAVDGTVVYSETHSPTTNAYGLVTLDVGEGATTDDFTSIDWGDNTYYMKVEMDAAGGTAYSEMGTTQLLSVPYALFASAVDTPLTKLGIMEDALANPEDALFEVKRKDGQTVFAVYNEGARVYVDDSGTKGPKGGFAIGGIKPGKGITNEYFRVTPDSIRMYINDEGAKGTKGGFAIGGFSPVKGILDDFMNVSGTSTAEVINPSEPRLLWYPNKEAFLSGRVLVESPDSVGTNSMATGFESKAIGNYSQALGYQAIAREDYSTAIGYQAIANSTNSFALGQWAQAKNDESYAFGRGAIAEGFRSFAFGSAGIDSAGVTTGVARATGDYSVAFGQGSVSSGWGSFSFGLGDTASGNYATSLGYKCSAKGVSATTAGWFTIASGNHSTALGMHTAASGGGSTSMGWYTTASGQASTAIGYKSESSGEISTAIGYVAIASGDYSMALGSNTTASQLYSTAFGRFTTASGNLSTAFGFSTVASGNASTSMGSYTAASGQVSTAMGYETESSGLASTSLGNNTLASGDQSIALGLETVASGYTSTAMGYGTIARGGLSIATGRYTIARSQLSFVIGRFNDTLTTSSTTSWVSTDPLFVIGNGTSETNRSSAMTVLKNGDVGLGTMTPQGTLDVNGSIYQRGSELHADYVFENEYELESINEHTEYMWKNKHLPAVPKAKKDENGNDIVEWGARSRGVLEELEKAHVYIDQLNNAMKNQQEQIDNQQSMIEELKQEIEKLKNQ